MSSADTPTGTADETTDTTEDEVVETDERREALAAEIADRLGAEAVVATEIAPGQDLWIRVTTAAWGDVAHALRHDLGFTYFTFLSAIDWLPSPFGRGMDAEVDKVLAGEGPDVADTSAPEPAAPGEIEQGVTGGDTRFQVFGRVYSTTRHLGVTVKADVPDDTLTVPTWTGTYSGADWHEREAWEMYGITFDGHPHLKHIYLPSDFEGNPLRKDFPLLARHLKPWPGIVDVEPMPGDDDAGDASGGEGE